METIFKQEPLTRAIEAIVAAGGSNATEAALVAENLVTANLLGHDSHGIGMIPRYIDAVLEGGLAPNQHPKATLDTGALLALDGNKGYGQSIGRESMQMAIERAKQLGSCVMTLGNSHHLGRIGHWAEMAVAEGFVSIHFVNVISHARVAPYAGRDARFGTNPRGAVRPRLCDERCRAGKDARRAQQGGEGPPRPADRSRGPPDQRSPLCRRAALWRDAAVR
jgi:hydroxycarboxylate dehydrogenase B